MNIIIGSLFLNARDWYSSNPVHAALIAGFAFALIAFASGAYFFRLRYKKAKERENLDYYEIAVRKEVEALPEFDEGDIYHS